MNKGAFLREAWDVMLMYTQTDMIACCNSGYERRSSTERIILVTKSSYSRDLSYYVGKTEFNKVEISPPM
ncbi:hypothetical protein GCK72_012611 [Caenorhabditis remanei]|uniref:Uncharacterized protein n=1 Tax=Caenorhabditis remanei TaxID=31234 RepID=A0A6A5GLF7_CAERE|nr:hypothetical protein GCK72_012611 [Caenorhabditis remanei]KAF1756158.1 hypothetical protein GCK72_012611 [Caenorhabditis remanei]